MSKVDPELLISASQMIVHILDDLWNNQNFKIIDEIFSNDCLNKTPYGESKGPEKFRTEFVFPLIKAFPNIKFISNEVITDLPTIINRWTFIGNQNGEYFGIAPSNKKISWSGVTLNRMDSSGKIVEVNIIFDRKDILDQINSQTPSKIISTTKTSST